jgi:hypothetical protein
MGRYHDRQWLTLTLVFASALGSAQQAAPPETSPASTPQAPSSQPLPQIRDLLLDVERNDRASEAARKDYTYHVHLEEQEFSGEGNVKKTSVTDSESMSVDGVRIDRVVARNGKPLTPAELRKEDERIDKEVARAKSRRQKHEAKGEASDSRGDVILSASRILELGTFSNPRRVNLEGRPTIVVNYAGDASVKTRNAFEGIVRNLAGTVWIDEKDRVLVRGEGHFLNDFKVGGGLILKIHKGLSFDFRTSKINGEVWLPASVDGQGSARILLLDHLNGHFRLTTSDYRKFRATSTIIQSNRVIGPDGLPLPDLSPRGEPTPVRQVQPQP